MLDTPEGNEMYVEVKSVTLAEPLPGTPGLALLHSPCAPPLFAHHSLRKASNTGHLCATSDVRPNQDKQLMS